MLIFSSDALAGPLRARGGPGRVQLTNGWAEDGKLNQEDTCDISIRTIDDEMIHGVFGTTFDKIFLRSNFRAPILASLCLHFRTLFARLGRMPLSRHRHMRKGANSFTYGLARRVIRATSSKNFVII
uniref:Uncharacterized protein n=1 Tax=Caenorhabditis japonica TaxID=281687 RepID=A0A8R1IJP8_CAEJA